MEALNPKRACTAFRATTSPRVAQLTKTCRPVVRNLSPGWFVAQAQMTGFTGFMTKQCLYILHDICLYRLTVNKVMTSMNVAYSAVVGDINIFDVFQK